MYECDDKMVSHPSHYQSSTGLEVIDVIEAFTEGLEGIEAADTANLIKYSCRWHSKGQEIRDLNKVIWYATHLIEHLEKKEMREVVDVKKFNDRTSFLTEKEKFFNED